MLNSMAISGCMAPAFISGAIPGKRSSFRLRVQAEGAAAEHSVVLNPSIKKDVEKVVDTVVLQEITKPTTAYCRCWRSGTFPLCDGSHVKHNKATAGPGDVFRKRVESMAPELHLYVNVVSQPSRAILIFCRLNNIVPEIHHLDISKGEHKTPEYKAINPMGQLPAIVEDEFKLFESHTILRYLATTYPGVCENWYPSDPKERARIDSILDWHHGNLRRGATGLFLSEFMAPMMGAPKDSRAISEAEKTLDSALTNLEEIWLDGASPFLGGLSKPSIADLILWCEIKELELMGAERNSELLGSRKRLAKWLSDVQNATSPHSTEVHSLALKAFQRN